MIYVVVGLALVGCALLYVAHRATKNQDIDAAAAAFIPAVLGAAVLSIDVLIVVGFGIYKLFGG